MMRDMVIETLAVALLNLRYPGRAGSLKPSCFHWQNTVLDARIAAGEMIVSTASGQ